MEDRSGLVPGTYQPDATNTGILAGSTLTPHAGDITMSAGQTLQDLDIAGSVVVNAANCTIRNCRIKGVNSAPGSSTNLITVTGSGASNLLVEDCEIAPQYPHWNWGDGIIGHDFIIRRCDIFHCTDGVGVFNTTATRPYATNVIIEANFIHDMAWWTGAVGVVHPSDTETHNDCIQHQGGFGTRIVGNTLRAEYARQYAHWYATNPAVEPFTSVAIGSLPDGGPHQALPNRATGTDADGRYNWDDISAIMVNANVGDSYQFTITDNWIYGGNYALNAGGVSNPGTLNFGLVVRNKFDRRQGAQSTGGDNTVTIQLGGTGWDGFVATGGGTSDANTYMDNGHEVRFRGVTNTGGAVTKVNSCETGLSDGTGVTTGNSGGTAGDALGTVSAGTSQTIQYSTTSPMHGTLCHRFNVSNALSCVTDLIEAAANAAFSARCYVLFESLPSASDHQLPVNIRGGASTIARTEMNTSGNVRLSCGAATSYSASALSTNTWYRFEIYGSGFGTASTAVTVDIYVGDATGTPFITLGLTGQTTAVQADRLRMGKIDGTGNVVMRFDDIKVQAGTSTGLGPAALSFTATQTDDAGSTDALATLVDRGAAQTDSAGSTDALATLVGRGAAQTDDAGSTDALTAAAGRNLAQTDSAGTTDALTTSVGRGAAQTDSAGTTDAMATLVDRGAAQTDSAGTVDSVAFSQGFGAAQTDSAGTTDALSVGVGKGISDTAGTTDSVATVSAFQRAQTDDAGSTDALATLVGRGAAQTDSAGTTDAVSLAVARVLNQTDDAGSTDAVQQTLSSSGNLTQTDDAGTTDAVSLAVDRILSTTDSAGTTDAATAGLVKPVSATDDAGSTDALAFGRGLGVADSVGSTDALAIASARASALADDAGSTDSIVLELIRAVAVSDDAGTTDSALIELGKALTIADDAGSTDSVLFAVHHELVILDDAGVTDAPMLASQYTLSIIDDSGSTDAAIVVVGEVNRNVTVVVTIGERRTVATVAERDILATAGPRHWSLSMGEQNG